MNWFRRWFAARPRPKPTPRPRIVPQLEALEKREVLTVTYNGGAILHHVEVQALYYGSNWATNSALNQQAGQFEGFLQYLVTSPYMDMLTKAGYNLGQGGPLQGSWSSSKIQNANLNSAQFLQDSTIQSSLQADISSGALQPNDANRLYVVYVEPGIAVNDGTGATSQTNFFGYHTAFFLSDGTMCRYAVVASPGGINAAPPAGLTSFQSMTMTSSHEIAEAVTDPNVGYPGLNYPTLGWEDTQIGSQGEIGDITANQPVTLNGYTVQKVADQNDNPIFPAELQVVGENFSAIAGKAFSGLVAFGNDSTGLTQASNLVAYINWGDGADTQGSVSVDPANGGFLVSGTHTYATSGNWQVGVGLQDQTNSIGSAGETTTETVVNPQPALTVTGLGFSATAGQVFSGNVAVGADPTGLTHGYNLGANITWGDGGVTDGASVIDDGHGDFYVSGTHTYATSGNFPVFVQLFDETNWNTFASETTTETVRTSQLTLAGKSFRAYAGEAFSGNVGIGQDRTGVTHGYNLDAIISWGDGASTQGSVYDDGHGNFFVSGAHTYTQSGNFTVSISLQDRTNSNSFASAALTQPILDAPPVYTVGEYGGYGVWRHSSQSGWQQLTTANATAVSVDSHGDVVGEFQGYGVWRFEDAGGWRQLTVSDASQIVITGYGIVVGQFQGHGVWRYENATSWQQLTTSDAAQIAAAGNDGDIVGEFQGHGVWRYEHSTNWQQLTTSDATQIAVDDSGDVVGEFKGYGVWRFDDYGGWRQLTPSDATQVSIGGNGVVAGEFKGYGVWRFDDYGGWRQLTTSDAARIAVDDSGDVAGEFQGLGVWHYPANGGGQQLTASDALFMSMAD